MATRFSHYYQFQQGRASQNVSYAKDAVSATPGFSFSLDRVVFVLVYFRASVVSFSLKNDFPKFKDYLFLEGQPFGRTSFAIVFLFFFLLPQMLWLEFILKNANGVYLFRFPSVNVCFKTVLCSLETFIFFKLF